MIVYSVRPLLTVRFTCPMTKRSTYKPWIIGICSLTCLSKTLKPAPKIRIINPSFPIYKITLTLPVKTMISQREFQNHSKLNWAIIWLRRTTIKLTRRNERKTHQAMLRKTFLRIKSRKYTRRASIRFRLIRRTARIRRKIDHQTHLCVLAWTKIMAFPCTIGLVMSAIGQVTSVTSRTERALSRTQTQNFHQMDVEKNRNCSNKNLQSKA